MNNDTRDLMQLMPVMMFMGMMSAFAVPVMPQSLDRRLYYARLEHIDPYIRAFLKRQDIEIHDYTRAVSREQAIRFLKIRYPGYRVDYITEVPADRQPLLLQSSEYAPINPLYAAEEWAALPSERKIEIEIEAKREGISAFEYWLRKTGAYRDWVKLRQYYDAVSEITKKAKRGQIPRAVYPPFPALTKSLVKLGVSGYPEDVEECARRYPRERLLSIARKAGLKNVKGTNLEICHRLKRKGVILQTDVLPRMS